MEKADAIIQAKFNDVTTKTLSTLLEKDRNKLQFGEEFILNLWEHYDKDSVIKSKNGILNIAKKAPDNAESSSVLVMYNYRIRLMKKILEFRESIESHFKLLNLYFKTIINVIQDNETLNQIYLYVTYCIRELNDHCISGVNVVDVKTFFDFKRDNNNNNDHLIKNGLDLMISIMIKNHVVLNPFNTNLIQDIYYCINFDVNNFKQYYESALDLLDHKIPDYYINNNNNNNKYCEIKTDFQNKFKELYEQIDTATDVLFNKFQISDRNTNVFFILHSIFVKFNEKLRKLKEGGGGGDKKSSTTNGNIKSVDTTTTTTTTTKKNNNLSKRLKKELAKDLETKMDQEEKYNLSLRIFGFILGLIHSACGLVILFFEWFMTDFSSRYQVYDNEMLWVDCKNVSNIPDYGNRTRFMATYYCHEYIIGTKTKSMFYANKVYYEVDFAYIIAFIFLWTGAWHFVYISPPYMWKIMTKNFSLNINTRLRWVEYGPSAGLMMFLIAYFIGIEDVNTLSLVTLMMCLAITSTAWAVSTYCIILPIIINIVIMVFFWVRFGLLFEPTGAKFEDMPWFVTAILIGEFIMFQSFIVVYYMEKSKL